MSAARFEFACAAQLIALPEVMRLTGYCRTGVYKAMLAQLLPRPVKLGRASRWPRDEVLALHESLLRGDDDGARRALVRQLQARRGGPMLTIVNR
jgi:prophage regulatory protein